MKQREPITIADLYPQLSEQQREEAAQNLRQYLAVLLRIAERHDAEGKSINDLPVDCSFDDAQSTDVTSHRRAPCACASPQSLKAEI